MRPPCSTLPAIPFRDPDPDPDGQDRELTIKEMELKAQCQAIISAAVDPPARNRDAKYPKLPVFIDGKDEMDSYLLCFECYSENVKWEKNT